MGAKYTTNAASGFNSSPPPDDGSQQASNLVTWAKHKEKLADPVKNLADAINTDLVAAFDYAVRRITTSDSLVAGDHMRTVEIGPSVSTVVTVTLADAATMTNIYRVYIKNSGEKNATIARDTSGDTIDGVAADYTLPAGAAILLTTNNAANGYLIAGGHRPPALGIEQATTSGTSIDFTGIPAWVKRITIQFVGVSTNNTSNLQVQIGDAGGIETTGYSGSSATIAHGAATTAGTHTAGFALTASIAATTVNHGTVTLTLQDASDFTWVATGLLVHSDANSVSMGGGSKSLSAALDRVRITTFGGTATFDAGAINILYE